MNAQPISDLLTRPVNFLTLPEAAEYLRVSPRTVHRWVREGRLKCFQLGKTTRFTLKNLEEFIQSHSGGAIDAQTSPAD